MPTGNADINPYQSPAEPAGHEPTQPEQAAAGKRRSRWHVSLVTLLYIYSGLFMMPAAITLFCYVAGLDIRGIPSTPRDMADAGMMAMLAPALFFAARSIRLGRWWPALAALVLGMVVALGEYFLASWLGA